MSIVLLCTVYSTLKEKLSSQYRLFKNFFRHASFCHFLRKWISKENLYQPWGSLWVFLCLVPYHVVRAKKSDVSHSFALGISAKWIDRKGLGKRRTGTRQRCRPFQSSKISRFQNETTCKTFLVKMSFICMTKKIIFKSMARHFASLWNRGFGKPRNDLFMSDVRNFQRRLRCRNWIRSDAWYKFWNLARGRNHFSQQYHLYHPESVRVVALKF